MGGGVVITLNIARDHVGRDLCSIKSPFVESVTIQLIKRAEKIKAMKRNAGELEEEEEEKEETKKPYRMIKQKESVLEE